MSATLTFDDSSWPLVIMRISGVMTSAQYVHFLERSASFLDRGEPYFSISDVRHAGIPPLPQCRQLAEWMRGQQVRMRQYVRCNAILVTSAPLRLSMSLVFHLMPPPMPHTAVSDMDAAVAFVLHHMREAKHDEAAERIRQHFAPAGLSAP